MSTKTKVFIPTHIPAPNMNYNQIILSKDNKMNFVDDKDTKAKSRFDTPNTWINNERFDYFQDEKIQKLLPGFQGLSTHVASDLFDVLHISSLSKPLNYLQVGELHGSMICSFIKCFNKHYLSNFHLIEPFTNDEETYNVFFENFKKLNLSSGCIHIKSNINLTLQKCVDNYYDIVFIHSNTLKDDFENIIYGWKKLKRGGILIFSKNNDVTKLFQASHKDEFISSLEFKSLYIFIKRMN
jgi:hypothetical protein